MSPAKRNKTVPSFRDFVFLRVLFGEHSELELAEVLSCWLMVEFHRVLRLESCSLASKTPELKHKIIICFLERTTRVTWNGKLSFGALWSHLSYHPLTIRPFSLTLFLLRVSLLLQHPHFVSCYDPQTGSFALLFKITVVLSFSSIRRQSRSSINWF